MYIINLRTETSHADGSQKSTSPDRIFLASRILFLATVSQAQSGEFIRSLVENKPPGHHSNIVEIVATKLDSLTGSILASEKMAKEAMSDLLKMAFNFLLHYPKVGPVLVNEYHSLISWDLHRW